MLGKPKQDVTVAGGIGHAHTRDPFLASFPREALEALARSYGEVIAKYSTPVLDVASEWPAIIKQNQSQPSKLKRTPLPSGDIEPRDHLNELALIVAANGLEFEPHADERYQMAHVRSGANGSIFDEKIEDNC